jgi:hypothetical protein
MASSISRSIAQAAAAGIMLGAVSSGCAGRNARSAAAPSYGPDPAAAKAGAKECCKGKNECKGKGDCKTAANACAGQNECKGKGGCHGHCPE